MGRLFDSILIYIVDFFLCFLFFFYIPIRSRGIPIDIWYLFSLYLRLIFIEKFGRSVWGYPVLEVIKIGLFRTILILLPAIFFATVIGYFLGVRAAWKRKNIEETFSSSFWLLCYGLPVFSTGLLLIIIFSIKLDLFPIYGLQTPAVAYKNWAEYIIDTVRHLVLPITALTLTTTGIFFLIMKSSVTRTLNENFIQTAKAKGLSDSQVMYNHAARASLSPAIDIFGLSIVLLSTNEILIEYTFSIYGLGLILYRSVAGLEYLNIGVAGFLLYSAVIIAVSFLLDIIRSFIDPRITTEAEK